MRKPTILITGSQGQLGKEIEKLSPLYSDYDFLFTDIEELDIANIESIKEYLKNNKVDIILNCAAYTAVDRVEEDRAAATKVNTTAVKNLAKLSAENNILLVHISTDYVFDGTSHRPYTETDKTNPNSAYGVTKLNGELEVITHATKAVIIRTSWLYSASGNNFVKTIVNKGREIGKLKVVFDQIGTPTYAFDLAKAILDTMPQMRILPSIEIYNYSNEGAVSWYDFAKAILELSNIECKVDPIESKEFPTPAKRPHYSVLNKSKFKRDFRVEIPYWKDSLKHCLKFINE